jgi:hypothetical protein
MVTAWGLGADIGIVYGRAMAETFGLSSQDFIPRKPYEFKQLWVS